MALIDDIAISLDVNIQQLLASAGRTNTPLRRSFVKRDDLVVATFVETANATGAINFTLSTGLLQREGVTVTRTEQGAGRIWLEIYGFILIVEPVNPADLTGNPVGLSYQWAGTLVSTLQSLLNGTYMFLADQSFVDAGFALNLDFGGGGTTKKKVTVVLIGSAT